MSELLKKNLLDNWQQCCKITEEIHNSVPKQLYFRKPFSPRFKNFAWEFACILTTREMYQNGLISGKLNRKTKSMLQEDAEKLSKEELKKKLREVEKEITEIIKNKEHQEISFFGAKTDKLALLSWLCQHEQLHFGKLMLMCAQAGISQSKKIKEMWGWNQ